MILAKSDGTIIAHPKKPQLNYESIEKLHIPRLKANGKDGPFEARVDRQKSPLNVVTSKNNKWKYICVIQKKDLTASVLQMEGHF
ncbi:hypothetical protein [Peribacillus kribbensis]|uniref:hypothetical protein n=1 Tax=Peribacillus kribbensis TaxID=356658 RepID=UPI00040DAFA5|nr:hypothetical protein [Peribacillus kribbensis]